MLRSLNDFIEMTPGIAGGKPRLKGRRISVQDIAIWHERLGQSVPEIASDYDLSPAEIHAALAYYFENRESIDERIREGEAFVNALRQQSTSKVSEKLQQLQRNGSSH